MTSFPLSITCSYRGKSSPPPIDIPREVTSDELVSLARQQFDIIADDEDILLKLLYKGKVIAQSNNNNNNDDDGAISHPFLAANETNVKFKSPLKIIVMGTQLRSIDKLNSQRSDPLMRGFDHEQSQKQQSDNNVFYWGRHSITPHRQYKFIQLQECTDASFGTRPNSTTPHAFSARRLLHRLSTDPGLTAILTSRQLVVNTLSEMDPIDDVLMQKQQARGGCLLGYNTNHGYRIDIKLRSDDITTFRPYEELCATLIHELSHNWCSEHDVLFWTNYAQMRVENVYYKSFNLKFLGHGK